MGVIFWDLVKELDEKTFMGKSYTNMSVISGKINLGALAAIIRGSN